MKGAEGPQVQSRALGEFASVMSPARQLTPPRIALEQDAKGNGLAKLVLALIELLRELLERQAIRRIDAGSLSDDEIERLGSTFMQLADQMDRLKRHFGLQDDDLNIDLGPLGKLL